jgi:hypothetical protein
MGVGLRRSLCVLLMGAQMGILAADAFAADTGCHCSHEADDPCPCPAHRGAAASDGDMPCPMHHAAAPMGPGFRSGCAMSTPHLALTVWFNLEVPRVSLVGPVPTGVAVFEEPVVPPSTASRPPRPPPRLG